MYLQNTETILLQQIALAEKIRGEKEKAVEIWELLLKDYGRSKDQDGKSFQRSDADLEQSGKHTS